MTAISKGINCPCCDGDGWLMVHDENYPGDPPQRLHCCHCNGHGLVSEYFGSPDDPTLQTFDYKPPARYVIVEPEHDEYA